MHTKSNICLFTPCGKENRLSSPNWKKGHEWGPCGDMNNNIIVYSFSPHRYKKNSFTSRHALCTWFPTSLESYRKVGELIITPFPIIYSEYSVSSLISPSLKPQLEIKCNYGFKDFFLYYRPLATLPEFMNILFSYTFVTFYYEWKGGVIYLTRIRDLKQDSYPLSSACSGSGLYLNHGNF